MAADLAEAVRHHLDGRLSEAACIYQAILEHNPDDADALHLLGVVAHQQGDQARAGELIGRALALRPGEAPYYADLAEVYRATGQLERAVASCRTALALQPDSPEAANNLGLALLAQGD